MVLFAEGTRSLDGRLGQFKNGAFKIAKEAGKRVVPVSIGNLHFVMPPSCTLPVRPIRHAFIHIHPPITTVDKSVKVINDLCFEVNHYYLPYFMCQATTSFKRTNER
ncbi:1-acyl-sn-glycerol-3-phosphate acyltransferase [archaeon]|nr:MAG: 1-acyl-sn-glycerol-3-phosphate acyltransferase [archaeon]